MSERRTVYLHVGAPKTGTTYLQARLALNVKELASHDVHVPRRSPLVSPELFHFRAALDLLGQDWGGPSGHAQGSWDALVRRVRRRSGTVVVSHEILAPAPAPVAARALRELGLGADVHVVYTVRDLARQLPAAWQESIKQGRRWTYPQFLRRSRQGRTWFAKAFDLPSVLETWGADLPPENVHVVTVPHRGGSGGSGGSSLWERFCEATAIDPGWAPRDSKRRNPSLGLAETEVVRLLNERLDRTARSHMDVDDLVRGLLAEQELTRRPSTTPLGLPPRFRRHAEQEAQRWTQWVTDHGVNVHGDLADLQPAPEREVEGERPKARRRRRRGLATRAEQLDVALDALRAMTEEAASRPTPGSTLVAKVRRRAGSA